MTRTRTMEYLNTTEMQALEKYAVEHFDISLEQMMQNAGKAIFDVVMDEINPERVLVVSGKGNNGGDALVTAHLLHKKGIEVSVLSPYPIEEFSEMAKAEMEKVRELGIPVVQSMGDWPSRKWTNVCPLSGGNDQQTLVVDSLFGFSLKGNPRPPADKIIEQILYSRIPVLAVDVPSGLDVHDGSIGKPTIKANYTVALGMLKKGFEEHPNIVGKVYLGDLGIPEQAYKDMGYEYPLFKDKSYLAVN